MRAWMSLKFSQIQPLVSMVTDRVMMGKTVSPLFLGCFSSVPFYTGFALPIAICAICEEKIIVAHKLLLWRNPFAKKNHLKNATASSNLRSVKCSNLQLKITAQLSRTSDIHH